MKTRKIEITLTELQAGVLDEELLNIVRDALGSTLWEELDSIDAKCSIWRKDNDYSCF